MTFISGWFRTLQASKRQGRLFVSSHQRLQGAPWQCKSSESLRSYYGIIQHRLRRPDFGPLLWNHPMASITGRNQKAMRSIARLGRRGFASASSPPTPPKVPSNTPSVEKVLRVVRDGSKTNTNSSATSSVDKTTWWQRFLSPKEMPERHTFAWYREIMLICTVFAITGSSTMVLVRPAVKNGLGLKGSFKDGPWSYRICSIVIMSPIYATLLVIVGTLFGRHAYFRHFSVKIFSRFGIPPELMDSQWAYHKKNFRKW